MEHNEQPTTTTVATKSDAMVPSIKEREWALEQRKAQALASSPLVPKEYANNIGSCLIALDMAARTGAPPLMVMQNLYIVHGRPSWSSSFLIAAVNSCGRFTAMRYEERGTMGERDYGLRAVATEKGTGEVLAGTWITAAMVEAEGWAKKNGSKWLTMPEQMYRYRAAAFWARAYAPEIAVGLHTAEEVIDVVAEPRPVGTMTMRLTRPQMALLAAEIKAGKQTPEDVQSAYPNLDPEQLEELRCVVVTIDSLTE
jgi:hypothetical protein